MRGYRIATTSVISWEIGEGFWEEARRDPMHGIVYF